MRDYPAKVSAATLLLGVVGIAAFVSGVIALTSWLSVPAETVVDLPAPGDEDQAPPGALVCPAAGDLGQNDAVGASTLIDCPDVFDGREVSYTGEAIRAVIQRRDHAIVQVNDDPYAEVGPVPETRTHLGGNSGMTVLMGLEDARRISILGSYRAQGDLVTVTGTFFRASRRSGGEPAIHASRVDVVRPGELLRHDVSGRRLATAAVLGVALAALVEVTRRRRRT